MKFKVTYASGLVEEVESSDSSTVEEFINVKFGISVEEVTANGATIELLSEDGEPAAVVEPTTVTATEETPAA